MQALPAELDRLLYWGVCRQADDYDERQFLETLAHCTESGAVTDEQAAALCGLLGISESARGLN